MSLRAKLAVFSIFVCAALVLPQAVFSPPKPAAVRVGTRPSAVAVPDSYKAQLIEPDASPIPPGPGWPRLVLLGCVTMAFIVLRRR